MVGLDAIGPAHEARQLFHVKHMFPGPGGLLCGLARLFPGADPGDGIAGALGGLPGLLAQRAATG